MRSIFEKIYEELNHVSPLSFDCGTLCGAVCCRNWSEGDSDRDCVTDKDGVAVDGRIYLLPGEESLHDRGDDWLRWKEISAKDEGFPASWLDRVFCVNCKGPEYCKRDLRPIQCRTFPLAPHLSADGRLFMVYYDMELPYHCPILEQGIDLEPDFAAATLRAWKCLINEDSRIYDLVYQDSRERERLNGGYRMA